MDASEALIEPFTTAVATTLQEIAGVEVVVRDAGRPAGGEALADVSVGMRLASDVVRWAILTFPAPTAAALARRVLADVGADLDAGMIRDCAGELLNVISGQAKTLTFGTPCHFTFTTPTHLTGGAADSGAVGAVVKFESECGPFALLLCAPPVAAAGGGSPVRSSGV